MILELAPDAPLLARIAGGATGIVAGWTAVVAKKGGRVHRVAGTVFFVGMLFMSGIGAIVAPMLPSAQWTNTTAGIFTFYLTATAWATVQRRPGEVGRFERV